MSKLSIGFWCDKWKKMYWMNKPSQQCQAKYPNTLTKQEYDKYISIYGSKSSSPRVMTDEDKAIVAEMEKECIQEKK